MHEAVLKSRAFCHHVRCQLIHTEYVSPMLLSIHQDLIGMHPWIQETRFACKPDMGLQLASDACHMVDDCTVAAPQVKAKCMYMQG